MRATPDRQIEAEQIIPLRGRVLIRRAKKAERTLGGIYLPEQTRDLSQLGTTVNIGDSVTQVKKDDLVVFSAYAASPIIAVTGEEADLVVVREADIFGIVQA